MKKILATLAGAALALSLAGCVTVQAPAEDNTAPTAAPTPTVLPSEPTQAPEPVAPAPVDPPAGTNGTLDPALYDAVLTAVLNDTAGELCLLLDDPTADMLTGTQIYNLFKPGVTAETIEGVDMDKLAYDLYNGAISGYCPQHTDKMVGTP